MTTLLDTSILRVWTYISNMCALRVFVSTFVTFSLLNMCITMEGEQVQRVKRSDHSHHGHDHSNHGHGNSNHGQSEDSEVSATNAVEGMYKLRGRRHRPR